MKMKQALVAVAAMVVFVAANLHAQTLQLAAAGSSALWLELGQASATTAGCNWTAGSGVIELQDTRVSTDNTDSAKPWVTWTPGTVGGNTCAAPGTDSVVNIYLNTDSVVGNRCFFASPRCTIVVNGTPGTGAGSLVGFTDTNLPASVISAINGKPVNVAATDIRPEDAAFAMMRALTACGTPVTTGSQYLGLGYQGSGANPEIGNDIEEAPLSGSGAFHAFGFNLTGTDPISGATLPGTYTVTPVGAVPIVVFVNPSNEAGFGSLLVSNIDRATLAGYLDGTYGRTSDLALQTAAGISGSTVFVREPLSGTYNTMEYAIPNSLELRTSQDVGLAAFNANTAGASFPPYHCASGAFNLNPLVETAASLGRKFSGNTNTNAGRYRAIGTGDEVAAVLNNADSLGYSFWSAANFKNATAQTGKYLTVDGVDPIQETWSDGLIPTSSNELLSNVTLSHVKDGTYPIWSLLRLVSDQSGTGYSAASALVSSAAKFLSSTQPDFVPVAQLQIVRSHFAPPNVTFPCFGTGSATGQPANGVGSVAECGGDVGGLVYSVGSDKEYNTDNATQLGNTGERQ
jgi:ABC-type phosphate transport system substrate-binding protein